MPRPITSSAARQLKGELEQAIALLRRATTLKPDHVQAHNNLGVALLEAMRLDEARAPLRRAIALDPNLALAHNNLGNVFWNEGRLDEALDSLPQGVCLEAAGREAREQSPLQPCTAHPDYDAQAFLAEHRLWASRFADRSPHESGPTLTTAPPTAAADRVPFPRSPGPPGRTSPPPALRPSRPAVSSQSTPTPTCAHPIESRESSRPTLTTGSIPRA